MQSMTSTTASGPLANTPSQPWGHFAPSSVVERLRGFSSARSQGYLGKRLAFLTRKLAMNGLAECVDVEVFGYRMRIEPFTNLAEKRVLFTPQYFDPVERDWLKRILPADAVFIDIGANVGAYSFFAASCVGPTARIIALEPQPDIFRRLTENLAFNPGVPIEAVQLAVADVEGTIQLFLDHNNAGESSMRRIASHSERAGAIDVEAKPLAQIVAERDLPRIDALKIDIEGAEDLALVPFFESASEALFPTLMIIENSPESWQTDCIALARRHGYQVVAETRLNVVLMRG